MHRPSSSPSESSAALSKRAPTLTDLPPLPFLSIAQSRLDFAKKLIPSVKTVLIERGMDHIAASGAIKKAAGMDLKVALECTGVESSVWTAIFSLKFGGKCFVIGVGKEVQQMPFMVRFLCSSIQTRPSTDPRFLRLTST